MTVPIPYQRTQSSRIKLENVTLCAVSSTNMAATIEAIHASQSQIEFAQALLFTDRKPQALGLCKNSNIKVVTIDKILSSKDYSRFILKDLAAYITTSHCLIVQWDGHVIDASRWQDTFLEYDYIGASWPQFDDGHNVGNGGFSLRSRRLFDACQALEFEGHHPEDIAIARTNRVMLEKQGLCFAPSELADQFAAERAGDPSNAFGFHGVFLMPRVLGSDTFWQRYISLSDKSSVWIDFIPILGYIIRGSKGWRRAITLVCERILYACKPNF